MVLSLVALTGMLTRPSGQLAGVVARPVARPADPRSRRPLTPSGNEPQPASTVVLDPRQVQSLQSIPGLNQGTLLGELAVMLRQSMPGRLAELARRADARDAEVLASQAHALAGSCASIGGRQMQVAINAVENAAVAGDWEQMPARVAAVAEAWHRLDQALIEHLQGRAQ